MEIIITGASGFLGKNLIEYFCNCSYKVYGFGRDKIYEYKNPNFIYKQINWHRYDEIIALLKNKKINSLIHLASIQAKECEIDFEGCYQFNINKTFNLAKDCQKYGVENFLFASTIHVYKDSDHRNQLNELNINNSNYSNSKLIAEYLLSNLSKKGKTNFKIMRIANVIGPLKNSYKNKNLLIANDICLQALQTNKINLYANPLIEKNFIPISLFCRKLDEITKLQQNKLEIININTSFKLTLYQLANLVKEQALNLYDLRINIHIDEKYKNINNKFKEIRAGENTALLKDIRDEINNIFNEIYFEQYG